MSCPADLLACCCIAVQIMFVEACVAQDRLKSAARAVRVLGLTAEFPNIESLYRQRSLARLIGKRLWQVALSFVGSDAALQVGSVAAGQACMCHCLGPCCLLTCLLFAVRSETAVPGADWTQGAADVPLLAQYVRQSRTLNQPLPDSFCCCLHHPHLCCVLVNPTDAAGQRNGRHGRTRASP
jgi:hypothetical protein